MSRNTTSRKAVMSLATRSPLPNRLYHRIGDVARHVGVEPHVIRYWSDIFGAFLSRCPRSKSGQRVYLTSDAAQLAAIRDLLYVELYTLDGAKRQLKLGQEGRRTA